MSKHAQRVGGFTLVELMVVVAVVAVLAAMLLPALREARRLAWRTREMAGAQQLIVSYHAYAHDHRGDLITGRLKTEWVDGLRPRYLVRDSSGQRLFGATASLWAWRLAPWIGDSDFAGVIFRRDLLAEFSAMPDRARGGEDFMRGGRQWAFAHKTALGLNAAYVGGDHTDHCEFDMTHVGGNTSLYARRADEVLFADSLMVFASARDEHPDRGRGVVDGAPIVEAPLFPGASVSGADYREYHRPGVAWDPARAPVDYGYLDLRHGGPAAVTASFDGHVEMLGLAELRDMRRWANQATAPGWRPPRSGSGPARPPGG